MNCFSSSGEISRKIVGMHSLGIQLNMHENIGGERFNRLIAMPMRHEFAFSAVKWTGL